ncbi:ATP-grasp domain-containing protein [Pandoraea sp. ISTKB]|uniref:D-alanine--D-alanine ligase family protein n=1 Tax=Pandoraea sp. ISTKB TaxID=1586708 RepID=UPI0009F557B9|nr:ATP-grasp domain-containing protein [Pandoraea sp. ISTKB]
MRLGIVTGGFGPERAGALLSGQHVYEACASLGIEARTFDTAKLDLHDLKQVDRVFLTTHGWYGEDGKLQGALDTLRIPYSGSGVAASGAAYFKPFANAIASSVGLRVPKSHVLDLKSPKSIRPPEIFQDCGPQVFVKPTSNGCSQGAKILRHTNDLRDWINSAEKEEFPIFLASQFIQGRDISVGIVEIDREPVALPPLETRHNDQFYSFKVKSGKLPRTHLCPASISKSTEYLLKEQALSIHRALGCRGFSRVDFVLAEDGPWFLEVNTLPGLSRNGNLAQMGYALDWDYENLISKLISTIDVSCKYRP